MSFFKPDIGHGIRAFIASLNPQHSVDPQQPQRWDFPASELRRVLYGAVTLAQGMQRVVTVGYGCPGALKAEAPTADMVAAHLYYLDNCLNTLATGGRAALGLDRAQTSHLLQAHRDKLSAWIADVLAGRDTAELEPTPERQRLQLDVRLAGVEISLTGSKSSSKDAHQVSELVYMSMRGTVFTPQCNWPRMAN